MREPLGNQSCVKYTFVPNASGDHPITIFDLAGINVVELRSGHTLTAEERRELDDVTASAVHVDARCPRFVSKSGARTWSTRHSSSKCANWIWRAS